jgi:hypothetical protein
MGSIAYDFPFIEDNDLVTVRDGGYLLGNINDGGRVQFFFEGLVDLGFGGLV